MCVSKKKLKCVTYFYKISKYYLVLSTYEVYRIMKNPLKVSLVNVGKWTLSHTFPTIMAISVMELRNGDTKLERFLPKNQHTQR